ncbi:MAG: VOC family protein [Chloroflexi bacterium]|nr:VOC family protein [Chloroflexota bacterium]
MTGTNSVLGGGGFHHVAVRVADFDGAVHFYSEVLGFSPKVTWGEGDKRAVMLDTGNGSYLEVFAGGTTPSTTDGPILHYAIRAHDVDAVIENARAHGATVTVEPKDVTIQSKPTQPQDVSSHRLCPSPPTLPSVRAYSDRFGKQGRCR